MAKVAIKSTKRSISPQRALDHQEESKKMMPTELPTDKATKRVIAPFFRIIRRDQILPEAEVGKQFTSFLQNKPTVLIRDLSSFLSDSVDLPSLLHETADVLKNATKASGVTLYMMDPATQEIYQSLRKPADDRHKIRWKIRDRTTVAAYVAYKKDYVMVADVMKDKRFPEGVGYESEVVKSVLCIPVVTPDGECFAVIELCRSLCNEAFSEDDLKITLIVTGWMGAAVHQNSQRLAFQRQQELNDYLLDLTKCYFGESVLMEKYISELVKFAKVTLNAERCTIFIIDKDSEDQMADLFEDGEQSDALPQSRKHQKIRLAKERGIASLVAKTGIAVNVKDVYKDSRFFKEINKKTGFITRSIMCMPIVGVDGISGVLQVVNKKSGGSFSTTDETLFKTFCVYCALALRYTKVTKKMQNMNRLNRSFLKMVHLQLKPCIHDIMHCMNHTQVTIPSGFEQFSWYISTQDHDRMPQFCLHMYTQLIEPSEIDVERCMQFILAVRKCYRKNPYHNFEHAFNVCHCIFLILKKNLEQFSKIEIKALLVAALCHDLDHGGFTNNFLELTKDDLAHLYESSLWEHHHYYMAMMLLENFKIFPTLTEAEYQLMCQEINTAIIATDLQVYFINRPKVQAISRHFNWSNEEHRSYLKRIMMTTADLSGQCKPFLVSRNITDNLYDEFYHQGDLEKKMGLCPLSTMDREKTYKIPEDQVNFLSIVALPCLDILRKILPNTQILHTEAQMLMHIWQEIIDVKGKKCWRQDDSMVEKQFNYEIKQM